MVSVETDRNPLHKPFMVRWLSKPLVAGLVGVIAGKLLNRTYNR